MVRPGDLKHYGTVQKATEYSVDGQPTKWEKCFGLHLGIDKKSITENDTQNNTGNKQTLNLFTHFDARVENEQVLSIFNKLFSISQLDNVDFENRRLNFTITEM